MKAQLFLQAIPQVCFGTENLERIQTADQNNRKFYHPVNDAIEQDGTGVGEES